jgi:hypothetical protein
MLFVKEAIQNKIFSASEMSGFFLYFLFCCRGVCTYQAGALPLDSDTQPFWLWIFFKKCLHLCMGQPEL